jgi:hypothetical protein
LVVLSKATKSTELCNCTCPEFATLPATDAITPEPETANFAALSLMAIDPMEIGLETV